MGSANANSNQPRELIKPRRQVNHLASKAIDELDRKSDGAFSASPFYLQYVLELDAMGSRACMVPAENSIADAFDAPTMIGDIPLFPLSVGNRYWCIEQAIPACAGDAALQDAAVAYAMHQRGRALCHELPGPKDILRAVKGFARTITVSHTALSNTLQRMLRHDMFGSVDADGKPTGGNEPAGSFGPTLALLCREYGETREYWLFEASEAFLSDILTDYKNRVAQAWASAGGQTTALDPSWAAFEEFRRRVEEILSEVAG